MRLDQVPDEREPEPEAAVAARGTAFGLAEAFEHVRQEVRRDALAGVADREFDFGARPGAARR